MKRILLAPVILVCAARLSAQTNPPVRLALISISAESAAAADVLTAELSKQQNIRLLERDEIARVYREQALSAGNRDYLKLGRVLGADGLLLLETQQEGTNQWLGTRLVAVKPGVMLTSGRFSWPVRDLADWAAGLANHLHPLLPKLTVLAKDAVPISVVNLRSAVQSDEGMETERQLTLLTIKRLSGEPRLFVLERQRMELLNEEKELNLDESAFWSGSYLLEGVLNQQGYSKGTITLNARLIPPKGAAPVLMEASGSRTNFTDLINQLAGKVTTALQVRPVAREWSPADEAEQFYREARWALKWRIYPQARAAAESAWALGKRDIHSALVRVKAYTTDVPSDFLVYQESRYGNSTDESRYTEEFIRQLLAEYQGRVLFERHANDVDCVIVKTDPDPALLGRVLYGLNLYSAYSRTMPVGEPIPNSPWHDQGIEVLEAASKVLKHYHAVPRTQPRVAQTLAELRAEARSVATWISQSPSVRSNYYVGNRPTTHDELRRALGESANIYRAKFQWGCFWQEKPEDCVAVYRELMSSPVFGYLHQHLWFREPAEPRLAAWTREDRERAPEVWRLFLGELDASTNFLWRMEAKALALADAMDNVAVERAFDGFFSMLFANSEALVRTNVDLLGSQWELSHLISWGDRGKPAREKLALKFSREFSRRLYALQEDHRKWAQQELEQQQRQARFVRQKEYLAANTRYDVFEFTHVFPPLDPYTKTQAEELRPLLAAYKANLARQADYLSSMLHSNPAVGLNLARGPDGQSLGRVQIAMSSVGQVERRMDSVLHAPPAGTNNPPVTSASAAAGRRFVYSGAPAEPRSIPASHILEVTRFLAVPQDRLREAETDESISDLWLNAAYHYDQRLWLVASFRDRHGESSENASHWMLSNPTVAFVWSPEAGNWDLIRFPNPTAPPYALPMEYTAMCDGGLYVSGWNYLRRYDIKTRRWQTLSVPWQKAPRLFAVGKRLFAAHDEALFEVVDTSGNTRVLASTRRRPAVSLLDTLESLGSPLVAAGPGESIRAWLDGTMYGWEGTDWRELFSLPSPQKTTLLENALVLRSGAEPGPINIWLLESGQTNPVLCVSEPSRPSPGLIRPPARRGELKERPLWKRLKGDYLAEATVAVLQSDLYLLESHSVVTNHSNRWRAVARDNYHARLVCLRRGVAEPVAVPLRFDTARAEPPLSALVERARPIFVPPPLLRSAAPWLLFGRDQLYLGAPNLPGVWAIPLGDIQAALTVESRAQAERLARERSLGVQRRAEILSRVDSNHDGTLDPEEREAALEDQDFLELELECIDQNSDGLLQTVEVGYFDANQNRILDAVEASALQQVESLLAARRLEQADEDSDGELDEIEFGLALPGETRPGTSSDWGVFAQADQDRDRRIGVDEMKNYIDQRLRQAVRGEYVWAERKGPPRSGRPAPPPPFREALQSLWSRMDGDTNNLHSPRSNAWEPPGPISVRP